MRQNILLDEMIKKELSDDVASFSYLRSFSEELITCDLKIKSPLLLSGIDFFCRVFSWMNEANEEKISSLKELEGQSFFHLKKGDVQTISFLLPMQDAIMGERLALNLLSRSSAVSTATYKVRARMDELGFQGVALLDTRKTTPLFRFLEKYAVTVGGGKNHRFSQTDALMIKDNHKVLLGGLKEALTYFRQQCGFYTPIVLEIHNIEELEMALSESVKHLMLDNFTPEMIKEAVLLKRPGVTYELSGGLNLDNLSLFLQQGIDAISMGALTHNPPAVDFSLKMRR